MKGMIHKPLRAVSTEHMDPEPPSEQTTRCESCKKLREERKELKRKIEQLQAERDLVVANFWRLLNGMRAQIEKLLERVRFDSDQYARRTVTIRRPVNNDGKPTTKVSS